MARRVGPAAVLLDLAMPRMDGLEFARAFRALPGCRAVPIIALSAHALSEDRERARQAGCDGYLAKPVEPRKVLEEVARFLGDGVSV